MKTFINFKHPLFATIASCCLVLLLLASINVSAQTREKGPWWPNPLWGPADQAGASNWITDTKVLRSVKLVKTGKIFKLGHVYTRDMPIWGQRTFSLVTPDPYKQFTKKNTPVWNVDFFSGKFGQIGTQFDALGHTGISIKMADGSEKDVFYNGFTILTFAGFILVAWILMQFLNLESHVKRIENLDKKDTENQKMLVTVMQV